MKTLSHWDFLWCKGLHDVEYFVFLRKCLNEKIIEILWNYPNILSIFPSFLVLLSCLNTFFQLDVIISPGREEGICLHLWGTAQQQCMAAWFFLSNILVFCFQNCSDLLWEKNCFVIEKNFWNSRLKIILNSERFLKQNAFITFFIHFFGEVRKTKIAFEISWPLVISKISSFSRSLEFFFLTVGQNNFGNKIPFPNYYAAI